MRAVFTAEAGQFAANGKVLIDRLARAATGAIAETGGVALAAARESVRAGMKSNKWANSIRLKVYPEGRTSLHPAGRIASKIPYSNIFQTGGTVTAVKNFLWLPLPTVPTRQGGHRLSPKQYIDLLGGKLVRVNHPGKPPMLFGNISRQGVTRVTKAGPRFTKRALKRGSAAGAFVPLYIGVPSVDLAQKFDVRGAVAAVVAARLPDAFLQQLESL